MPPQFRAPLNTTTHELQTHDTSRASYTGRLLALLARLGESKLIEGMLDNLAAQTGHARADNAAIVEALNILAADRAAKHLQEIVEAHSIDALGASAALLAIALSESFSKKPALLLVAAKALVAALPGDPAAAAKDQWGRPRLARPDIGSVVDVVAVIDAVDQELANRAATHMLA